MLFLVITALAFVVAGCDEEDKGTPRDTAISSIYPPEPWLPDLKPLALVTPRSGMAVSVHDGLTEPLTFRYEANEPYFAAVFLFDTEPVIEDGVVTNVETACLGGVTSMAPGHYFNPSNATLDPDTTATGFYRCNAADPIDRFSTEQKLTFTEADFPSGTVYWAVLGYDAHYRLTHSSPLRTLIIN